MNSFAMFIAGLACASAALASTAGAQTAPCDPEQNSPQFVGRAFVAIQKGISALNNNSNPTNDARTAVRLLTDPANSNRDQNAVGQAFTMGQALALLLSAPSIQTTGTRADYGFAGGAEQAADLYVIADSVFTTVETLAPQCAEQVGMWRQGPAWVATMNKALLALNESRLDSADVLARRALLLDRKAPYAYVVLGGVARQRLAAAPAAEQGRLYMEARENLSKALELAQVDTTYREVVQNAHQELGEVIAASIATAPMPERAARAREAALHFTRYAELAPSDLQKANAMLKSAEAFEAVNDTASVRALYTRVSANPSAFGERSLLTAGVLATRFGRPAEAAALYKAALSGNPYHRDALRNLSVTLIKQNDYTALLPITERLTTLDPNNPETWVFRAYAYAGLAERATNAAQRRAYTDSSTKYDRMATQMPVKVTFTEFSPMDTEARLRGRIENAGTTGKSYTLVVEMLDKAGNVLATEQAQVGPVAPKTSGEFTILAKAAGIVAFRYKPIQ